MRLYSILLENDKNKDDIPHELQKIAEIYYEIYLLFNATYKDREIFRIFIYIYNKNFVSITDKIIVRDYKKLKSFSLQTPVDIDTTFRNKVGNKYHGQVFNITETTNPQNQLNLVTTVAVEPNYADDCTIHKRIDQIKTKCSETSELHTESVNLTRTALIIYKKQLECVRQKFP